MKIVRFEKNSVPSYGILKGNVLQKLAQNPFLEGKLIETDEITPFNENIKLLPPCEPSKIVAVGLNYKSHAEEMKIPLPDEPIIFLKPSTAMIGHKDYIVLPENFRRVDYECELAVVIGKKAKKVSEKEALDYIFGYTCFNDVTERTNQKKDGQWTRAKGYDTFAPVGPWIETEIEPSSLKVETILNGKVVQSGNTEDLIFSVEKLVAFISNVMTLLPGDIIATGTPAGIGPIKEGDIVEISIEHIGILTNYVKK
jgi:2-keto-4-pentenoate hydratase/2-oxohepta-3-ene-1,7-dioic acid hydratase in catechol pathway